MASPRDYSLDSKVGVVEGLRKAWKRNFNGTALNTEVWQVVNKGAGQTYSVTGGQLTMNSGTGINEEMTIRSLAKFQIPFRVQITHTLASRIANNELYLEVVNAAGDTYAGWMFDGLVTTTGKTTHANGGISQPASPTAGITITASSGPTIREIDVRIDCVEFADRGTDSTASSSVRATKTRTTLDPYEDYYIQLRSKNVGGIAPASSTAHIIEQVLVQDTNDVLVEVSGGRGNNSAVKGLPVVVNNTLSVNAMSLSGSATSGAAATINRQAALSNTGILVKSTAGKIFGFHVANPGAASAWFHLYNKATAAVVGTDIPVVSILVPPGETKISDNTLGLTFTAGLGVGASDNSAVTSAIAPAAALIAQVYYL